MENWKTVHEQPATLPCFSNHSHMTFRLVLIGGHGSDSPTFRIDYLDEGHEAYPLTYGSDEPVTGLLEIAREVLDSLPKSIHGYGTPCCGSSCPQTAPSIDENA